MISLVAIICPGTLNVTVALFQLKPLYCTNAFPALLATNNAFPTNDDIPIPPLEIGNTPSEIFPAFNCVNDEPIPAKFVALNVLLFIQDKPATCVIVSAAEPPNNN